MTEALLFAATVLGAVTMAQSLAHALELPGKLRLGRDDYLAVQTIYYPGFTLGGAAEPLAIVVTALVLAFLPAGSTRFWLVGGALATLAATHLLFWIVVQPVNRQWLAMTKLSGAAEYFFEAGSSAGRASDWTRMRNRWEWGHVARAVTAMAAFILLLLALQQS